MPNNRLHSLFEKILNEYGSVYDEVYQTKNFSHPFGSIIRRDVPAEISSYKELDKSIYKVEGKCSIGQYAKVPYIPIFDKRITTSAKKGTYIVYLVNKDRKELTLAFAIGTTEGIGMYSESTPDVVASSSKKLNSEQIKALKEKCTEIRDKIGNLTHLSYSEDCNCGSEGYDASCIYNKKYTLSTLPNDDQLKVDLLEFVDVYKKYYEIIQGDMMNKTNQILDHWPSGARDTTEFPKVSVSIDASFREHLKAFTKMEGVGWTDYDAMNEVSGEEMTGSRLRTYRKMYEKLGLIYCEDNKVHFSKLGKQMAKLEENLEGQKDCILTELRLTAIDILSRYQLKNPSETEPLPEDCDILPAICIWKAMRQLENKLHPEEINRVLLRVMKMSDLEEAIKTIGIARKSFGGKYFGRSEGELQEALGDPVHTDQAQARIAPWFSFAGWGGLIIHQAVDSEGYRNLVDDTIPVIDEKLSRPYSYYEAKDEADWLEYYIGDIANKMALNAKALHFNDFPESLKADFSKRLITSLLAKPFVILTGNSGTGKTRIARRLAEYLEVETSDGYKNWVFVPVGADWTDNTKILGFYNPLADEGKGDYVKTGIINLIESANNNRSIPYFLILDEMNLSYVERYFSDFLSHMETENSKLVLDGYKSKNEKEDGKLTFPDNIFVIGTVNIDETTYMFSPKVLDRANVIEFKPSREEVLELFSNASSSSVITPANNGNAEAFLNLAKKIRGGHCGISEDLNTVRESFGKLYDIVEKNGFEFAFRTVKEIRQYLCAAYELTDDSESFEVSKFIDEEILQKILPKIHGNRKEIGTLLEDLSKICEDSGYVLSKAKIDQMKGKLVTVQYASFI